MKKYSKPDMEIMIFSDECVVTASPTVQEAWTEFKNNGGQGIERNLTAMRELTQIVF